MAKQNKCTRNLALRVISCLSVMVLVIPIFNLSAFAYTVDDVREMLGRERIDGTFSDEEVETITKEYMAIEQQNLIASLFETEGLELGDSEVEAERASLVSSINSYREKVNVAMQSGAPVTEVLGYKTKLESLIAQMESLRQTGVKLEVEYTENVWSEKYHDIQEKVAKAGADFDIGDVGQNMRPPLIGTFAINSPFGSRIDPFDNTIVAFHNGLDMRATLEEAVLSQWNGVVTNVFTSESIGNVVEITHGTGLKTRYLHLNSTAVEIGDAVKQYQKVGGAGTTGTRSTGVHLHFEIYLDGKLVNPILFFGQKGINAYKEWLSNHQEYLGELALLEDGVRNAPPNNSTSTVVTGGRWQKNPRDINDDTYDAPELIIREGTVLPNSGEPMFPQWEPDKPKETSKAEEEHNSALDEIIGSEPLWPSIREDAEAARDEGSE